MNRAKTNPLLTEPCWLRCCLIALALAFLGLMLVVPLLSVFWQALAQGWALYVAALTEADAWSAIKLTLLIAAIVVPVNAVLGVAMA